MESYKQPIAKLSSDEHLKYTCESRLTANVNHISDIPDIVDGDCAATLIDEQLLITNSKFYCITGRQMSVLETPISDENDEFKKFLCTAEDRNISASPMIVDDCEANILDEHSRQISVVEKPELDDNSSAIPIQTPHERNDVAPSLSRSFTVRRSQLSRIPAPEFRSVLRRERLAQADKHFKKVTFDSNEAELRCRPTREKRATTQIPVWGKRLIRPIMTSSFVRARSMKYSTYRNHHSADQCDQSRDSCIDFKMMNSILSSALVSDDELSNPETCKFIFDFIDRKYNDGAIGGESGADSENGICADGLASDLRSALRKRALARCFSTDSERRQCDNTVEYDWDDMFDKDINVY